MMIKPKTHYNNLGVGVHVRSHPNELQILKFSEVNQVVSVSKISDTVKHE